MVYCTQDVAVSTVDFEGALPGMTHYFAAAKRHHLGMLEMEILSEEEAAGTNFDNPLPTESIDVENTSTLAKEMGVSQKQFMANQKAVLREAEKSKQAKAAQELKQLEQAVPELSIGSQRVAFEKENKELKLAKRSSLYPGQSQPTTVVNRK